MRSGSSASAALATCTQCHGDPAHENAAPPRAVNGATDTADPAVGAHQSHLVAGHFRGPVACQECHAVPASVTEPGHLGGGVAVVRFDAPGSSGLARARGVAPSVAFGPADAADARSRPDATCTVYCHGVTLDGGTRTQPSWAGRYQAGSSTLDCSSCHGFPPGGRHPQGFVRTPDAPAAACARCHSRTVTAGGEIDLAGGKHLNGVVDFGGGEACSACHGDGTRVAVAGADPLVRAAPPGTVTGAAAGAHLAHVNGEGTPLRPPLACAECHARSAAEVQGEHPDEKVDVDFGPLAAGLGAAPAWDAASGSCAATYCHGATLSGGKHPVPLWNGGSAEAACGNCHGVPPPAPHPPNSSCGTCHPGYTSSSVNAALHVDGKLDVAGLTCSSCHGSALNPAPPAGTRGETLTTDRAVGAHQAHLSGGGVARPVLCEECHVVPSSPLHADGAAKVTFGGVALTGGAKPAWDGTSCTASYCHGQFTGGNALNAPAWTGGSGQAACGSCHTIPPPSPHPQNSACGGCHTGYTSSSVVAATHVDGKNDVGSMTCSSCHGSAQNPAPPFGTRGETATTALAVGAHQAHLAGGTVGKAVACSECHVVPSSLTHADGTVQLTFGALATQGGAQASFAVATATCSNVYCHGQFTGGNTANAPVWTTVDGSQVACGSCHTLPPPPPHPVNTSCGNCHPGYGPASVNVATHVDGHLDLLPMTCTSCHGDASRVPLAGADANVKAAPPADSHGNLTASARGVGAHAAHVNQATFRSAPLACSDCHSNAVPPPGDTAHVNGTVAFAFGPLAKNATWGGVTPAPTWDGTSCASTYCHGAFKNGANATMTWAQDVTLGCTSCHGAPPGGGHPASTACGSCHGAGYSATTVNPATHLDGKLDVNAMTCTSCHGDPTRVPVAGADPTNAKAGPPVDTSGQTSSTAVGGHLAHFNRAVLTSPLWCSECHTVPTSTTHATGTVAMAWGARATAGSGASYGAGNGTVTPGGAAAPVWNGGAASCSATYCHGNYAGTFTYSNWDWSLDQPGAPIVVSYAGKGSAPAWSDGAMACDSCHANPPRTGSWHGAHQGGSACQVCHPDAIGTDAGVGTGITNPAQHVNGQIEIKGFGSTCIGCH
ncbi:hypothetical protein AMYX_18010 [Anaeromyxobacter diazotrophicus]|uniref:Cytochrome C family protein n=1 Tax=Anaeromyxobacter diazotrophicus TaxID=2590199 RepID=A0A7I9VLQ8_9BACT|nr:hypothetical protein AMYX_18010 [Anaeromyxobacter diazotrophicus]